MKIIVFLFPVVLFCVYFSIKFIAPSTYLEFIKEDSFVENAQALFFFLSSIVSFWAARRFIKIKLVLHGVLYGILAVGLFFIFGEEISWGQRIFNITTLDYFEKHNFQHETNIHNLNAILPFLEYGYILIGFYGASAWLFKLLMPQARTKRNHLANFVAPDWHVSMYFFCCFFIYTTVYFTKYKPNEYFWMRDHEFAELLLALGFLFFAATNYVKSLVCLSDGEEQKKLWEKKYDRRMACFTGIIVLAVSGGILFTHLKAGNVDKSAQQVKAEMESLKVESPSKMIMATNLFHSAYVLCSEEQCKNPLAAIEYLTGAINLKPDYMEAIYNRGTVYITIGQYQKAIQDFSEVIRQRPNHVKACYNRGIAFIKIRQYPAAIEDFDRSIILKPDYADAYNNRGTAYLLQGNRILGCQDAKKACELGTCRTIEAAKKRGYCNETS